MKCYKCPVCEGRGTVPADFYTPGYYTANTAPCVCKSCGGKGVIWGLNTYSEFEHSGKVEIEDVHSYTNYCQPMQAYSRTCKNCRYCDEKTNYCEMHCVDVMDTSTCSLFYPKNKLIFARS